jgi:hypothetical protein
VLLELIGGDGSSVIANAKAETATGPVSAQSGSNAVMVLSKE